MADIFINPPTADGDTVVINNGVDGDKIWLHSGNYGRIDITVQADVTISVYPSELITCTSITSSYGRFFTLDGNRQLFVLADGTGDAIDIQRPNTVTVKNLVVNGGGGRGIVLGSGASQANAIIENNVISNSSVGIWFDGSNATITGNNIRTSDNAITLGNAASKANTVIARNTSADHNAGATGILFEGRNDGDVYENKITCDSDALVSSQVMANAQVYRNELVGGRMNLSNMNTCTVRHNICVRDAATPAASSDITLAGSAIVSGFNKAETFDNAGVGASTSTQDNVLDAATSNGWAGELTAF